MTTFPKLSTGAVTQLPFARALAFNTHVLQYCDGSEQRFPVLSKATKRWEVDLHKVNRSEMDALVLFFEQQQGRYSTFSFVDPFTTVIHEHCALAHDDLSVTFIGAYASGRLIIEEIGHE